MATTKYEVTYIIKPDVDEDNKKALVENYDKVIADNGGTMVESKDWASVVSHMKLISIVKVLTTL